MRLAREIRRSSRIVTYFVILGSFLALCNVAIQPVSSQVFSTSTTTQTNVATYFTVSAATSNISVTVLTLQYTTTTSNFTVLNIQFTTMTSVVTHIQIQQVTPAAAPAYHSFNGPANPRQIEYRHNVLVRSSPTTGSALQGPVDPGVMLQLVVLVGVVLASALIVQEKE